MSIYTFRWTKSVAHAWIMWSQPKSPLFDPEKADRLWDRRSETIITGAARLGLRGLLPEDVDLTFAGNAARQEKESS